MMFPSLPAITLSELLSKHSFLYVSLFSIIKFHYGAKFSIFFLFSFKKQRCRRKQVFVLFFVCNVVLNFVPMFIPEPLVSP